MRAAAHASARRVGRAIVRRVLTRAAAVLVVSLLTGCRGAEADRSPSDVEPPTSTATQLATIDSEARAIDLAFDQAEIARGSITREGAHWQLSGLLTGDAPRFVRAVFTEGHVVREERYYWASGKLVLVRTLRWWDVEEGQSAPEPPMRREFFLRGGRTILLRVAIDSTARPKAEELAPRPAAGLLERSQALARILAGRAEPRDFGGMLDSFVDSIAVGR